MEFPENPEFPEILKISNSRKYVTAKFYKVATATVKIWWHFRKREFSWVPLLGTIDCTENISYSWPSWLKCEETNAGCRQTALTAGKRKVVTPFNYWREDGTLATIRGLQACARKIELVHYLRDLAKTAVGAGAVDSTGTVILVDFVTLLI